MKIHIFQVLGVIGILYEDKKGRLIHPDDVDALSPWEIEDLQLHVYDEITV
ncbi:MAG: hypothetical protein PHV16_05245 [Candidatus Nanoarchaeia archaeon]|nr:hypothetical protein [Candidatus Nanoarchaeia archaeon]